LKTIQVKALVGDVVYVHDLEKDAQIVAVHVGRLFVCYEISYFANGKQETAMLFAIDFDFEKPKT
jgi:hypothetical protein